MLLASPGSPVDARSCKGTTANRGQLADQNPQRVTDSPDPSLHAIIRNYDKTLNPPFHRRAGFNSTASMGDSSLWQAGGRQLPPIATSSSNWPTRRLPSLSQLAEVRFHCSLVREQSRQLTKFDSYLLPSLLPIQDQLQPAILCLVTDREAVAKYQLPGSPRRRRWFTV